MSDYNAFFGFLYICYRCGEKKSRQEMVTDSLCIKCDLKEEYGT